MFKDSDYLKSPYRYLMTTSAVLGVIVLVIYFKFLPDLIKVIPENSSFQPEQMKNRFIVLIISYFAIIPLLNFYVWKKEKQFRQEETETKKAFDFNPNDPVVKEKLKRLEEKRKRFFNVIGPIVILILGVITAFIAWSFMMPFFELSQRTFQIP